MSGKLRVLPLGGLGEIGKNMTVVEYDGRLVVVSNDLAWFTEAHHIAPTLQAALDHWEGMEPALRGLAGARF